MIFKDYYKILGLETNKVNTDDIKAAYREQAKKYHPDVNIGNKNAEERFKDINEAYNILLNPTTKRKYDRMWNSHIAKKRNKSKQRQEKTSAKEEVFEMFFGTKTKEETENKQKKLKKEPIQGENIDTGIDVSLSEAFYGKEKKLSLRTVNGSMKTFKIKIPEGIRNGEKIRLIGQGKPGENGGRSGDLLIKINILDDEYVLSGADIYRNIYITPWEAVLGAKVEANTIDGVLSVYIPKGSQNGDYLSIDNKGYKDGKGGRGKLILQIKIMVQKNISDEEKELYKQLKKVSKFNPRQAYN